MPFHHSHLAYSDILIHNPYGEGQRVILDVAVTGVVGRSRCSDEDVDQPMRIRFNQKKAKYDHIPRAVCCRISAFTCLSLRMNGLPTMLRLQQDVMNSSGANL